MLKTNLDLHTGLRCM